MKPVLSKVSVKTIYVPFFIPVKKAIEKIRAGFEQAPIIRVKGLPIRIFCLADPDHIAQLFRDGPTGRRKQPSLLPRVAHVMGNGSFIMRGNEEWTARREQIQPAFRRSEFAGYTLGLSELTRKMLDGWRDKATDGKPFDVFMPMRALVVRINMQMFFSKELDDADAEHLEEEIHFIETHFAGRSNLSIPFPGNIRFRRHTRSLRERMHRLVQERRQRTNPTPDLLDHFMRLRCPGSAVFTDDEIVDEILSVFFGAVAMSAALTWALYLIASHPEVQKKMAQEIEAQSAKEGEPSPEDYANLPYLQAVLKEVLRLYPASWGQPRWAETSIELGGVEIPAGTLLIPMVYLVHRDPRFWKDPEAFSPERFTPEGHTPRHQFAYFPFSLGPRACVGAGLSQVIMQTVLGMIVNRYRLSFSPRFPGDPKVAFGFGIPPEDGIRISIGERVNL